MNFKIFSPQDAPANGNKSLPVPLPGGALPTVCSSENHQETQPTNIQESLPVSVPTNLPSTSPGLPNPPNLPVGGGAGIGGSINGVPIPGLTTNPNNLLNNVAEAVEILQYLATLIQTLLNTGTINIPGIAGVGLGVQGAYISALLGLAKGLLPIS